MKKLIIALLFGWALPAAAADLPAATPKASASISCTTAQCSGAYAGFSIEGAGPIATGQADLTNGAGIGGHVGYQVWNGSLFAAVQVGATGYFGASTFTPAPGVIVGTGSWSADYVARVGYGLQGFFNSGNTTAPSQGLFANLNNQLISPFVEVGGRTRGFQGIGAKTGFASGAGVEFALGNRWNLDVEYLHIDYRTSENGISVGTENIARAVVKYMF